jgi:hypothetical protein
MHNAFKDRQYRAHRSFQKFKLFNSRRRTCSIHCVVHDECRIQTGQANRQCLIRLQIALFPIRSIEDHLEFLCLIGIILRWHNFSLPDAARIACPELHYSPRKRGIIHHPSDMSAIWLNCDPQIIRKHVLFFFQCQRIPSSNRHMLEVLPFTDR